MKNSEAERAAYMEQMTGEIFDSIQAILNEDKFNLKSYADTKPFLSADEIADFIVDNPELKPWLEHIMILFDESYPEEAPRLYAKILTKIGGDDRTPPFVSLEE